jgi:hypothetical protein
VGSSLQGSSRVRLVLLHSVFVTPGESQIAKSQTGSIAAASKVRLPKGHRELRRYNDGADQRRLSGAKIPSVSVVSLGNLNWKLETCFLN